MGKGDAARYEQQQKERGRGRERKQRALEHIKNAKALQVYNASEYYVYAMQENSAVFYAFNYLQLF